MVKEDRATWKNTYFDKMTKLLEEYPKCFVVGADNVGSRQMQQIRIALRGHAIVLMGKNTMMRKAIRRHIEVNASLEKLLPHIRGNVGLVFTKGDLTEVAKIIQDNKVAAPAKAGAIASVDVTVPAQCTVLGPEKTSFFQALSIQTKITKGTIEILNDVKLIKIGDKVGASEATLLTMLGISPFTYGLQIEMVYDNGTVFELAILSITDDSIRARFMECVANVSSISLAIGYPTLVSVPHSLVNGFKNLLSLAAVTDIEFKEAETLKEYLKDPSKFAATAAPAAAAAPAADKGKKEEKKPEPEEEEDEDEDMGFGLFD